MKPDGIVTGGRGRRVRFIEPPSPAQCHLSTQHSHDGYPLAVGIGIIVGVAVLIALTWRQPTRRASLDMPVGMTATILATVAIKILVYDYP